MIYANSLDDLTCKNCIWVHSFYTEEDFAGGEGHLTCGNQPPCNDEQDAYYDRNDRSFCNKGMWVIGNVRSDINCVMSRPDAINILLRRGK